MTKLWQSYSLSHDVIKTQLQSLPTITKHKDTPCFFLSPGWHGHERTIWQHLQAGAASQAQRGIVASWTRGAPCPAHWVHWGSLVQQCSWSSPSQLSYPPGPKGRRGNFKMQINKTLENLKIQKLADYKIWIHMLEYNTNLVLWSSF